MLSGGRVHCMSGGVVISHGVAMIADILHYMYVLKCVWCCAAIIFVVSYHRLCYTILMLPNIHAALFLFSSSANC